MLKFGVNFPPLVAKKPRYFIQQYSVLSVEFEKEKKNEKKWTLQDKSQKKYVVIFWVNWWLEWGLLISNNLYNNSNNNRGYRGPLLNILNIQEAIPNKFILCHLGIWTTKCHHKCSLSHMKGSHRGHRVNKTIKMHNVRKIIYFRRKNSWALDRKIAVYWKRKLLCIISKYCKITLK